MNTILTVGKHNQTFDVNWHSHKSWELVFCTSGNGTFLLENEKCGKKMDYKKNDLVIIPPNSVHANVSEHGFKNIHITMDTLSIGIDEIAKINDTSNKMFFGCMANIYYIYNCDVGGKETILQNLGDLLSSYIISFSDIKRYSPIIEKMRHSIFRHFAESTFDLNDMFDLEESYNSNYLKKLFKKEIGTSPQQFLIDLRITYARKLLSNTLEESLSISNVAYECGYDDPLYFSRVFKAATGHSPKEYHKMALAALL